MTVPVTDHAVLRFLERECGIDVDEVRRAIGEACTRGAAAGAPVVRIDRARFVLAGGKVVTVLGPFQTMGYGDYVKAMRAKGAGVPASEGEARNLRAGQKTGSPSASAAKLKDGAKR